MNSTTRRVLIPVLGLMVGLFTGWASEALLSQSLGPASLLLYFGPGVLFSIGIQVVYIIFIGRLAWRKALNWWLISAVGHCAAVLVMMSTMHMGELRVGPNDPPLYAGFIAGLLGAAIVAAGFNDSLKKIKGFKIGFLSLLGGLLAVLCMSDISPYPLDLYLVWQAGMALVLSLFLVM
jgi:hypothetical protein